MELRFHPASLVTPTPCEAGHDGHQLRGLDRFGDVNVVSDRRCSLAILGPAIGCQSDSRRPSPARGFKTAHLLNERVTVPAGHFDVGDDDVRRHSSTTFRASAADLLARTSAPESARMAVMRSRLSRSSSTASSRSHTSNGGAKPSMLSLGHPRSPLASLCRSTTGLATATGKRTVNVAPFPSPGF
jgi:hypothetical protein